MKTIYIFRHAEPMRLDGVESDQWPLSAQGHEAASLLFSQAWVKEAVRGYTSPLLRAQETLRYAGLPVVMDERLRERRTGTAAPNMGDCWLRQYEETSFKCPDGESFDEAGQRMAAAMEDIQAELKDGETAIVVSHAAAICAYLMHYCTIVVTDRATKTRAITWNGQNVYQGRMPPLTGFVLTFQQGVLISVEAANPRKEKYHVC